MNLSGYNERMQGREYSNQFIDRQKLNADKIYRITIYSKDRISGDVRDGVYAIDIPEVIHDMNKYHFAVEEFLFASEPVSGGTNGVNRTYIVETSLTIPNSYSTSSKTNTRVLLQTNKSSSSNFPGFYFKPVTSISVGIPLTDMNFMRNNQLRFTIKKCDDTPHDSTSFPDNSIWSMTMVLYAFSP
jgi:hypothetical protein